MMIKNLPPDEIGSMMGYMRQHRYACSTCYIAPIITACTCTPWCHFSAVVCMLTTVPEQLVSIVRACSLELPAHQGTELFTIRNSSYVATIQTVITLFLRADACTAISSFASCLSLFGFAHHRLQIYMYTQPDALKAVASVVGSKRSASSLSTSTSCAAEEDPDTAGGCPLAREFNGVLKIVDTAADADADSSCGSSSSSSDTVVVCNSSSGGGACKDRCSRYYDMLISTYCVYTIFSLLTTHQQAASSSRGGACGVCALAGRCPRAAPLTEAEFEAAVRKLSRTQGLATGRKSALVQALRSDMYRSDDAAECTHVRPSLLSAILHVGNSHCSSCRIDWQYVTPVELRLSSHTTPLHALVLFVNSTKRARASADASAAGDANGSSSTSSTQQQHQQQPLNQSGGVPATSAPRHRHITTASSSVAAAGAAGAACGQSHSHSVCTHSCSDNTATTIAATAGATTAAATGSAAAGTPDAKVQQSTDKRAAAAASAAGSSSGSASKYVELNLVPPRHYYRGPQDIETLGVCDAAAGDTPMFPPAELEVTWHVYTSLQWCCELDYVRKVSCHDKVVSN
eukprot:6893-Heterococcus_DN1.PRE.3